MVTASLAHLRQSKRRSMWLQLCEQWGERHEVELERKAEVRSFRAGLARIGNVHREPLKAPELKTSLSLLMEALQKSIWSG